MIMKNNDEVRGECVILSIYFLVGDINFILQVELFY